MRIRSGLLAQLLLVIAALLAVGCASTVEVGAPAVAEPAAESAAVEPSATEPAVEQSPAEPAVDEPAVDGDVSADDVEATTDDSSTDDSSTDDSSTDDSSTDDSATVQVTVDEDEQKTYDSIRDIDFRNGFVYTNTSGVSDEDFAVTNGEYVNGEWGDLDYFWFGVQSVRYGDLTGDGVEEAVVARTFNTGGSGFFDSVEAFRLVEGVVTSAGIAFFGDRAFGGVGDLWIEDGQASVLSFTNGEGSCCPNEAAVTRMVLGEVELVRAETMPSLRWLPAGDFVSGEPLELEFLAATSAAYVRLSSDEELHFTFDARQGQRLTIDVLQGDEPLSMSLTNEAGTQAIDGNVALPADGLYNVQATFAAGRTTQTTLLVAIDQAVADIEWSPTPEQTLLQMDPFIGTSLAWPVFSSDTAAGVDSANQILADFARALDDEFIDNVTEFPPLERDGAESIYSVSYEVTYADNDLASVRFNWYAYACCWAHPNFGPISVVLDLDEGRVIEMSEILDLARIEEIQQLWFAGLEAQGLLADSGLSPELLDTFESVGVAPDGIELGIGRSGAFPGTEVVITYEELGDLVQPAFLARLNR